MQRLRQIPVFCAMVASIAAALPAAEVTPAVPKGYRPHIWSVDNGHIDWAEGVVVARGTAACRTDREQDKTLAQKAALNTGSLQATRIAHGLQIDRYQRFEDLKDSEVHLDIIVGKNQKAAVEWVGEPPAMVCRLHLVVPIWGERGIANIVADEQHTRAKAAARIPFPQPRIDEPPPDDAIFIDARGIDLLPCLFPIVIVPEGRVLYNFDTRQQVHGEIRPVVKYIEVDPSLTATTRPTTQPSDEGPIFARAVQAGGNYHTDIVLRRTDAARISTDPRAVRLLKEGRVYVIVDPLKAATTQSATTQGASPARVPE